VGQGDLHEPQYDSFLVDTAFAPVFVDNMIGSYSFCSYDLWIYPTAKFESRFMTNNPAIYCGVVIAIFMFTAIIFVLYDYLVQRRQNIVMVTATRTNDIVSSLFPSNIRDRMLENAKVNDNSYSHL
jgi:hypothetical protein